MKKYSVRVATEEGTTTFSAIAECAADAVLLAFDYFGVCSVTVRSLA